MDNIPLRKLLNKTRFLTNVSKYVLATTINGNNKIVSHKTISKFYLETLPSTV